MKTHYIPFKHIAFEKCKGYWRCQAKACLDKKIASGQTFLANLKRLISDHSIDSNQESLTVTKLYYTKKTNVKEHINKTMPSSMNQLFITSTKRPSRNTVFNKRIFQSLDEQNLYNNIPLKHFNTQQYPPKRNVHQFNNNTDKILQNCLGDFELKQLNTFSYINSNNKRTNRKAYTNISYGDSFLYQRLKASYNHKRPNTSMPLKSHTSLTLHRH